MRLVSVLRQTGLVILTVGVSTGAFANPAVALQTSAPAPTAKSANPLPASKPAIHKKKRASKAAAAPPVPVIETRPPDPPPPDWPANDKAKLASVGWNGRELSIAASNSTLKQILHDVSTATGLKVDGIGNDQRAESRVYGSYGPAPARDVLSQLLEGSGYNVLMIGDQGEGTPRELLLTTKSAHGASPSRQQGGMQQQTQNQDEEVQEEPEQPEPPPPPNRPLGNSQNPQDQGRTPQQQLQDLQQQRLQQLQQQQQQPQQPPQPSGQPPAYVPPTPN
jgi:hypothetical protein